MKHTGLVMMLLFVVALVAISAGLLFLLRSEVTPVAPSKIDPAAGDNKAVIARVGNHDITRFHLRIFRESERIKTGEQPMADYGLLIQLLEMACNEEVGSRFGIKTDPAELEYERARIDRETKEPEKLKKIKAFMAQYPGMFETIIIRTGYLANQKIHRLFNYDKTIQADAWRRTNALLEKAKADPASLVKLAKEANETAETVDSRHPTRHMGPGMEDRFQEESLQFVKKELGKVAPGDLKPDPIDGEGSIVLVRLVERGMDKGKEFAIYEHVSIPKLRYDKWFREQISSLKMEILDAELSETLKTKAKGNLIVDTIFGNPPANQ